MRGYVSEKTKQMTGRIVENMAASDEDQSSRFLVSGWEDDINNIDEEKDPHGSPSKEVLWAAENGNLDLLKQLIEKDHNLINVKDKDGYTPLHRSCYGNHIELVKYLIKEGADISAKTEMLWEPLHSCCQWNHYKCAKLLLDAGADVNVQSEGSQTPLHIAASHGVSYEMVQLLLNHPYINVNIENNSKETAYDVAKRSSKYYKIFEMKNSILTLNKLNED